MDKGAVPAGVADVESVHDMVYSVLILMSEQGVELSRWVGGRCMITLVIDSSAKGGGVADAGE